MNSNSVTLALTVLLAACLSSCGSTSSSGGQVINYPTVDEMASLESQWGMQPRQVKPRLRQTEPGDVIAPSASAPSAAAPAPLKELPAEQPAEAAPVPSQLR